MDLLIGAVRALSRLGGAVAAFLIAAAVAVVCHMVVVRYVLGDNTIWQTDFVTYSLVAATFVGAPYVLLTRGHVNVDVVPLYLGPAGRMILAVAASAIGLLFAVVLTVLAAQFWFESWENLWRSDSMWRVRLWIPYSAMPIGLGLLSLQMLAELADLLRGRTHPFGLPPDARGAAAVQVEPHGP